ncbi:MAG: hypothetical protein V7707_02480 [Motiliproteus sp.]
MDVTGVLEYWRIHILKLSDEERSAYESIHPGYWPAVVTGQVVTDYRDRWAPGSCIRSSLVIGLDLEAMRVMTRNSIYGLQGRGLVEVVNRYPNDSALAVGETMIRLGVVNLDELPPKNGRLH